MQRCKCCHKQHDEPDMDGRLIRGNGVTVMGYGSRYDFNVYQFTLVEGWYCYKCLDHEVAQGLCQPIKEWKAGDSISPWEWFYPKKKVGSYEERMTIDEEQQKKNWEYFLGPLEKDGS